MKFLIFALVSLSYAAFAQSPSGSMPNDEVKSDTEKHVEKFKEGKVKYHTREDEQRMEHPNDFEYMEGKKGRDVPKNKTLPNPNP